MRPALSLKCNFFVVHPCTLFLLTLQDTARSLPIGLPLWLSSIRLVGFRLRFLFPKTGGILWEGLPPNSRGTSVI